MQLKVIDNEFSVCKVKDYSEINLNQEYVFTGSTDEEKSLVCPISLVPNDTIEREDGWRAFRIEGVLDFSLIGILSKISSLLAANKIGIFAISTFNTDYILTKKENSKTRCCKRDSYIIANSVGLSKHGDYRGAFVVDRYYSHSRSLYFALLCRGYLLPLNAM